MHIIIIITCSLVVLDYFKLQRKPLNVNVSVSVNVNFNVSNNVSNNVNVNVSVSVNVNVITDNSIIGLIRLNLPRLTKSQITSEWKLSS